MKEVQRTSLTLLHDIGFTFLDSDLTLNLIEIYSFKVKFEVQFQCQVVIRGQVVILLKRNDKKNLQ